MSTDFPAAETAGRFPNNCDSVAPVTFRCILSVQPSPFLPTKMQTKKNIADCSMSKIKLILGVISKWFILSQDINSLSFIPPILYLSIFCVL